MFPLVAYYGGKVRMAARIVEEISRIPHTVYVEPYAGGAAVLFAKPQKIVKASSCYQEVINDISDTLITLYRVAAEHPNELAIKLEATLFSQTEHKRATQIVKNPDGHSDLDIAWAYFVAANCSFAHSVGKGWGVSVMRNHAHTWLSRILRLRRQLDRLRGVCISCENALQCIDRWDAPQTLFYCDPPYVNTECGHYSGWTEADWRDLCDKLDTIQGSYILSNYPHNYAPRTAQIKKEFKTLMTASGQVRRDRGANPIGRGAAAERTECLWIKVSGRSNRRNIDEILSADQLSLSL